MVSFLVGLEDFERGLNIRLLRTGASEDRWMVAPGCDE
jgi:hypothetical protein